MRGARLSSLAAIACTWSSAITGSALVLLACSGGTATPDTAAGGANPTGVAGAAVQAGGPSAGAAPLGAGAASTSNAGSAGAPSSSVGGTSTTGGSLNAAAGTAASGSSTGGSAGMATAGATSGGSAASGGVALFDGKSLDGFVAYREPATRLTPEQAATIFKVEDQSIRVYGDAPDKSTQSRHTLVSNKSFTSYQLSFEYKWGTKVFAPYTDLQKYPRDAGLLFHIHGDLTAVWPSSIEFQVKEGSSGDIFALYAQCVSLAKAGGTTFVDADAGGTEKVVNGSQGFVQHARSANFELPGWNALTLEVNAGAATYTVNGHVVNKVIRVMDKQGKSVTSGPIAFQAEHAEVFYRNIFIKELP